MSKNIVGLIAEKQSSEAVFAVKKALAKKLVKSISEAKTEVARKTYGSLVEFYGADEQPDYMNDSDNAYAMFFANALKKFGVSGPEDFQDDVTKQRFFDYVDHNWRAQDTVQTPIANASTQANMERGTQTQLPSPAAPPMAPTAPTQGPTPTTAQGNDPSLATMAPAGPSINKTAPLDQSGQDPQLNNVQNSQAFGGMTAGPADQYGTSGNPQGMSHADACPYCKGSGRAACPTCGRPHGLDAQQGGMGGMGGGSSTMDGVNIDQDPDLEIGDDDTGEEPLAGDEDGAMSDDQLGGDEDGMMGDDQQGGAEGAVPGAEEEVDDPFDDEDAYTIDASDFDNGGQAGNGDEDQMNGDDENGFGGKEEGDEDSDQFDGDVDGQGGEEGMDDDDLGDDDEDQDGGFGGGNEGGQFGSNGEDDDQDPDLEIGDEDGDDSDDEDDDSGFDGNGDGDSDDQYDSDPDEDTSDEDDSDDDEDDDSDGQPQQKVPFGEALKHKSWSRKERKADGKRKQREDGKKAIKMAEDFGFGLDDAEDTVFMTEAVMQAGVDPALNKIITYVQDQLNRIKKMRNTMLMQLRRQRAVIKKDPALGPEEKMDAMKQLATMAKDNRKFFKSQAKLVKAIFTGHLNGTDDMGGDDMSQEPGDEQQPMQGGKKPFPPKGGKGGFPPQGGDDEDVDMDDQDVDPDQDGDNDMDPDQDTDQDFAGADDSGDDDNNFGGNDGDEDDDEGESFDEPSDDDSGDDGNPDNDPDAITNDDDGDDFDNFKKKPAAPKKGGFPPKKGGMEENEKFGQAQKMPTFAALKQKKFGNAGMHKAFVPQAHPVKESTAIESKIKMLHMQIATQGDPTGKRKQALRSLEEQLKGK
jgi:hypothetical protein